ncbi:hypothetical protein RFEPED_1119 [Rickettsia felis str. Pedreira]|uniref:Uncharacterized protein n=1 Tax=Rickettsia felis str. Pedreira TaxID=1359196 RepID=A0A0F3MTG3_RICFI|nr:hypothetical protein [Rickettsia felis]KJV58727.1 hypothetical protein RFEPED_1119 [Rickettsia felis str. Pedreira]
MGFFRHCERSKTARQSHEIILLRLLRQLLRNFPRNDGFSF